MGSRVSRLQKPAQGDLTCLQDLINKHDMAIEKAHFIDKYIIELSRKLTSQVPSGHIRHGLLLLQRKCVAEGVREMYMRYAFHKYLQVQRLYRNTGQTIQELTDEEYLADVKQGRLISIGMCREYNMFQRHG